MGEGCAGGPCLGPPGARDSSLVLVEAAVAEQAAGQGLGRTSGLLKETNSIACVVEGRGAGAGAAGKGLPTGETGKGCFPHCPVLFLLHGAGESYPTPHVRILLPRRSCGQRFKKTLRMFVQAGN